MQDRQTDREVEGARTRGWRGCVGSWEPCLGCDHSSWEASFPKALQAGLPTVPNPSQPGSSSPSLWIALKGHRLFLSRACFFPLDQEEGLT